MSTAAATPPKFLTREEVKTLLKLRTARTRSRVASGIRLQSPMRTGDQSPAGSGLGTRS